MMQAKEGAEVVRQQKAQLDEICGQIGRDPATLELMVLSGPRLDGGLDSVAVFAETIGSYAEIGVTDFVVHWPRPEEPYAADMTMFERIFGERS
jgi:hypothetical protein